MVTELEGYLKRAEECMGPACGIRSSMCGLPQTVQDCLVRVAVDHGSIHFSVSVSLNSAGLKLWKLECCV